MCQAFKSSYLKNRKQKIQINIKFSSETDITDDVLQGSEDGPLLFNLFINDLVLFIPYSLLIVAVQIRKNNEKTRKK